MSGLERPAGAAWGGIVRSGTSPHRPDPKELQTMMAVEVAAADVDVESLRAQVEQEAALAQTTKAMQVRIPRRAAAVLAAEVERRIARGVYPSAESLVGEAVAKAFAGGHP